MEKLNVLLEEIDGLCIIRVKDTGIGISQEEQDKIFERFYMVDKSRSKKVGGSGLGLSIVKHIVKYHNGKISLTSKINEGTEVEIKLPI
ncbi:sensor histidine kinase [Schnuerera ultunensis]|uniref:sensor histidine kinase n=1 Tax=Schnuerera ultunensis TaxID=45497 RepID=UPI000D6DF45A|nr:HAMP domain-containing sensor histidine kinase [Schnuerera ultunensis]